MSTHSGGSRGGHGPTLGLCLIMVIAWAMMVMSPGAAMAAKVSITTRQSQQVLSYSALDAGSNDVTITFDGVDTYNLEAVEPTLSAGSGCEIIPDPEDPGDEVPTVGDHAACKGSIASIRARLGYGDDSVFIPDPADATLFPVSVPVTVRGGPGSDSLLLDGATGNDKVSGGSGEDFLSGGPGNDLLVGGSGEDWINGGPGNDQLLGGGGPDVIDDLAGADVVKAGGGSDTVNVADGADDDTVSCGGGLDQFSADVADALASCEQNLAG